MMLFPERKLYLHPRNRLLTCAGIQFGFVRMCRCNFTIPTTFMSQIFAFCHHVELISRWIQLFSSVELFSDSILLRLYALNSYLLWETVTIVCTYTVLLMENESVAPVLMSNCRSSSVIGNIL